MVAKEGVIWFKRIKLQLRKEENGKSKANHNSS